MKRFLKLVGIVILVFIITGIGLFIYLMNGQKEMKTLKINDVKVTDISDGIYNGKFNYGRWSNTVEVTVSNHQIVDITVVKDQMASIPDVTNKLINDIINKQSLKVDTVSGATITSKAFLKAVENALSK